jgi:hypothetical protein
VVGTNHEKVNSLHPITPDISHMLSCLAEAIIEWLAKLAEMVLDADITSLPRIRHLTFARALTCISDRIGKLEAQIESEVIEVVGDQKVLKSVFEKLQKERMLLSFWGDVSSRLI